MLLEDIEFKQLLNKIYQDRGLDYRQYRDKYLKRRIAVRMRANDVKSYREYITVLNKNPSEYKKLLDALTTNVTQFFRDPQTYKVIKEVVLPQLILAKQNHNKRIIRIWSAGCASGEEPYSLAILLNEILGDELNQFIISIYGTDIDEKSLAKAKEAEYEAGTVSEAEEKILRRYFTCNEKYRLKERIKHLVKFRFHDLVCERPLGHLDLILCRNVVIYFSKELQEKLFMKFYQALNKGGYLVLGRVESLAGEVRTLFKEVNKRERIYIRDAKSGR